MKSYFGIALGAATTITACAPPPPAKAVAPIPVQHQYIAPEIGLNNSGLDTSLARNLDKVVKTAIEEALAPGVAIAVGRTGHIAYIKGFGLINWILHGKTAVEAHTIYDQRH